MFILDAICGTALDFKLKSIQMGFLSQVVPVYKSQLIVQSPYMLILRYVIVRVMAVRC